MGYTQITATKYAHGSLHMTSMPYHGAILTHSLNRRVTDSAAATALATGHKTNNGMVAILPIGTHLQNSLPAVLIIQISPGSFFHFGENR
ncbi:MAG: alkaline phosphatase [Balneolaceae bacterium]|nr:alkaline phosphatase [Balneolaceae bacterium]